MTSPPEAAKASYRSWMVAQRSRRRPDRPAAPPSTDAPTMNGADQGQRPRVLSSKENGQTVAARGSRFSVLNDQDAVRGSLTIDNNDGGVNEQNERATTLDNEVGSVKCKASIKTGQMADRLNGPQINVSHANLMDGVQGVGDVGLERDLKTALRLMGQRNKMLRY